MTELYILLALIVCCIVWLLRSGRYDDSMNELTHYGEDE